MTRSASDTTWQLYTGAPLQWVKYEGEHIVFHPDSGETHYLNDFSALVLRCLENDPVTRDQLCRTLSDILGTEHADLSSQLDSLLTRFDHLGLVESSPAAADTK